MFIKMCCYYKMSLFFCLWKFKNWIFEVFLKIWRKPFKLYVCGLYFTPMPFLLLQQLHEYFGTLLITLWIWYNEHKFIYNGKQWKVQVKVFFHCSTSIRLMIVSCLTMKQILLYHVLWIIISLETEMLTFCYCLL